MREELKPIHARVFRIYLDFLRIKKNWSEDRIVEFLSRLDTSIERLADDGTWYSLEFADRFYESIVRETGDSRIAYDAGLFVHREAFSPVINQMIRTLVRVSLVYKFVSRFAAHFSKAAEFSVVSSGSNTVELQVVPNPGFRERPYVCENRRGLLAGVPMVFGLPPAEINETECVHRGDSRCFYGIKWQQSRSFIPLLTVAILSVAAVFLLSIFMDRATAVVAVSIFSLLSLGGLVSYQSRKQSRELSRQNEFLDQSLREIERKNKQLELVGEISRMTQSLMSPKSLGETLVQNICRLLEYDRALLLLVDSPHGLLKVEAFYGFTKKLQDLLVQTEFRIDADNNSGFFVKVVNSKKPVLIQDVEKVIGQLSVRSQTFAKILGAKSFVAVPLLDQSQSVIGVLAVDYTQEKRQLSIADQDLLMTLAGHLAISIHNAKTLHQIEENLNVTRSYSEHQKILRETFQKFVPTDLAQELLSSEGGDLFSRLLKRVKKRPVSILVADMVGFSTKAEGMQAEDVIDLVNTVFAKVAPIISRNHGFVDKFTGDGFIAVFEEPESCLKACNAATEILKTMTDVNAELLEKNYPTMSLGMGINYGQVILGNIGSVDRLNFTVMGEAVNLASRLESYTRGLSENSICVSSVVYHKVKDSFQWKDLGLIQLKGYREQIHAFELLATTESHRKSSINPDLR